MQTEKLNKLNVKKLDLLIDSLKLANEKFELKKTNSTTTLNYEGTSYKESKNGGLIKKNELFFIQKVLKYVSENCTGVSIDRSKITYIKQGNLKNGYKYSKDIYEIDLNGAYWNSAYKKKYISKEIYLQGLKVSKVCRLVALGNLAKCTNVFEFNGNEYIHKGIIRSETTEGVFFDCSTECDNIMKMLKVIANENFYFYWVDAIIFKTEKTKYEICEYLDSINVPYKIKKINTLHKQADNIKIIDLNGSRTFNFKKT
jgi:hypothetical protein